MQDGSARAGDCCAVAILCVALNQRSMAILGVAVLLGPTVVMLRWWNRPSLRIANVGLTAGLLPLSAGVLLSQLGSMSSPLLCVAICAGSGLLAGSWAGYALRGTRAGVADSLVVSTVALATALLGCIDFQMIALVALTFSLLGSGLIASLIQSRYVGAAS
jgi:hypothetical protein